jgi:hypothetical protein
MPDGGGTLQEILRLTKENNQMLHAMRRTARMHAFFKLIFYAVLVFGIVWLYLHVLAPLLTQMLDTLDKIQGASSQAQGQLSGLTGSLEKLRSFIPGMGTASSTH